MLPVGLSRHVGRRSRRVRVLALLCGLACLLTNRLPGGLCAQEPAGLAAVAAIEESFVAAIERAESSVVSIARIRRPGFLLDGDLTDKDPFRGFEGINRDPQNDPHDPEFVPNDFGSGVIVGVEGPPGIPQKVYILTNYHVVYGGMIFGKENAPDRARLFVRMPDRKGMWGVIYAADPRCDLAIVVVEALNAKPITFGNGAALKKGQIVIALGNSYATAKDGSTSASWGIVSNVRRRHQVASLKPEIKPSTFHSYPAPLGWLITVDTRLDLGTSGGALINLKGEFIGLTTSLAAIEGYEKSAGYAMALDAGLLRIIEILKQGKEVDYGFLGIQHNPGNGGLSLGVRVGSTPPGGPAHLAAVLPGDLIMAVNGEPVRTQYDLNREVGLLGPGATARLTVMRGTQELLLQAILAKWPVEDEENLIASQPNYPPWRGLIIDYSTARRKYSEDLIPNLGGFPRNQGQMPAGVLVLDVQEKSPAARVEINVGQRVTHVNQQPVRSPAEFLEAIQSLKGPVALRINDEQVVTLPE